MNWDDPAQRLALIERVGVTEYNRLQRENFARSTLVIINGYGIREVNSGRFGRIFIVDGLGKGHSTFDGAKALAAAAPARQMELTWPR
jgi:hypothetical protein